MTSAHYMLGDSATVMGTLPAGCVDLVLTSPPFLALRSYLPAGHPSKNLEMGSEPTPAVFIDALLAWTAACGWVLADHGTIAVELGDTYSGGSEGDGWPLAKSLALIPELYRVALAYGINPLTGEPSPAGRWRVRNVVRWVRPNPPVGALGDKFRPATSDMVVACRASDRWFDLDAVRDPYSENSHPRTGKDVAAQHRTAKAAPDGNRNTLADVNNNGAGAPPLDWWKISPSGFAGSHYATFPPELCVRPIKAMCPLSVCRTCGTPRRRVTGDTSGSGGDRARADGSRDSGGQGAHGNRTRQAETLGWTDCDCPTPDYQPGVVLDPFAGTGTTLQVAAGHGRHGLGIDLDERNLELARERIGGLFLTDGDQPPEWLTRGREVQP